jgi:hypothetical protein
MNRVIVCLLALGALGAALPAPAGAAEEIVRQILRQQSAAERSSCVAIQRTLAGEKSAALVVRTAIELGYNPCQVIRCALEGGADLAQVLQGATEAGAKADVVARCAVESGADRAVVAAIFSALAFEPNFCYFTFAPMRAPEAPPPAIPETGRALPVAQASPFTF